MHRASSLLLVGVMCCGGAQASVPPSGAYVPLRVVDEKEHCTALKRIATSMGLLPGSYERLTPPGPIDLGDEYRFKEMALVIPSGFDVCTVEGTRESTFNWDHVYKCRSGPLAKLPTATFDAMSRAWRSCLAAPLWNEPARVRYPGGGTSAFTGVANAYISTHFVRDPFLFSEGFCVLEKREGFIEMTCGARYNN